MCLLKMFLRVFFETVFCRTAQEKKTMNGGKLNKIDSLLSFDFPLIYK